MAENHEVAQGLGDGSSGADEQDSDAQESVGEESSGSMDELFLSPDDSDGEEIPVASHQEVETDRPPPPEVGGPPAEQSEPPPSDESADTILELENQLEELAAERDDIKNRMMRVAADLENFRKRTAREKEELRKYGIDKVVLELLPVLDNLERALEHSDKSEDKTTIVDGVRMVHRQFLGALKKHGVEGFESKGEQFDPQRHEAIQQVETAEHETGTILEQYQKGYYLHERLIRPALVVVARQVEGSESDQAEPEEAADAAPASETTAADDAQPDAAPDGQGESEAPADEEKSDQQQDSNGE